MTRDERIHTILNEHLSPSNLQVINDSHQHAGHSASPGTGDSHYQIIIVSNVILIIVFSFETPPAVP